MLEINKLLDKLETDFKRIIAERQLVNPVMIGAGGQWYSGSSGVAVRCFDASTPAGAGGSGWVCR